MGNVDQTLFQSTPDWKMPLSESGKSQARAAGRLIQQIVGPKNPILFYVSPYKRTKDTLVEIQSQLSPTTRKNTLFTREEPRLREQDFGNFQDPQVIELAKKER
jgi:broad specificity phosphatase PhoE